MKVAALAEDTTLGIGNIDPEHHDVAVIGLHPVSADKVVAIFDLLAMVQVPLLLLTPPLSSGEWELATRSSRSLMRRLVLLAKPNRPDGWENLRRELPELVRDLGRRQVVRRATVGLPEIDDRSLRRSVVAIGASAGGPVAVCETLRSIGEDLKRAGVVIVQHIEAGFEAGFVNWLGRELPNTQVALARHGETILPGTIRIAPAHAHLGVDGLGRLRLDHATRASRDHHRPAVNVLFEALARWRPAEVVGVLLSGMGADGVDGLLALRQGGALTITQDEASCAVFGMPKSAVERGAAILALPPREIGQLVAQAIGRGTR